MGLLSLKRLMFMQREQRPPRRRRHVQARNRRVASLAKRRGSPCQQEDNYQGYLVSYTFLIADARCCSYCLCVSHISTFMEMSSQVPNLTFSKETFGLNDSLEKDKAARELTIMGDHIMKKHSGIGLRTFRLEFLNTCYLDHWLEIAITPALEELILMLVQEDKLKYYNFPSSLLINKGGNSIKDLHLSHCAFHPTIGQRAEPELEEEKRVMEFAVAEAAHVHAEADTATAAAAADGLVASLAKQKGSSCQQEEDDNRGVEIMRYPMTFLPEDIWYHIHSLLPLQDAARTACVSHTFLRSWRCHPNLIFSKKTLGLNDNSSEKDKVTVVDHIMKKHSGIGLRTFKLDFCYLLNTCYLDRWLQIAITPAIEELVLMFLPNDKQEYYNFPCSLLFNKNGNSIKHLHLSHCAFHPTIGLNSLRRLDLWEVCITGDKLGCFISYSFALEHLTLAYCKELDYLRIPCQLEQLSYLNVYQCRSLQTMEVKAPNLSTFRYHGNIARLSDGGLLAVKNLHISSIFQDNNIHYACSKLPSIVPIIETLKIYSDRENVNTPIAPIRFLHLKCLTISLEELSGVFSPAYDYLSLAYFLDACPVLETFILTVFQTSMSHAVISEESSDLRQMPGLRHDNIKNVEIIGFCSAKSMVELTCHILENTTSLECLTLDTVCDKFKNPNRHSVHRIGLCSRIYGRMIVEAENALLAIKRYIVRRVPSTVKLDVLKPCSWCHTAKVVS
uniref:F-box domain-containing protein n=1 Tax=Leersia perrieri TaxID=77586 RepID=A0A0D9WJ56_9ORYZ